MKAFPGFGENREKCVVSLCDYSGNWPRPYIEAGYTVLLYDLKHGDDVRKLTSGQVYCDMWKALGLDREGAADEARSERVVLVLAAPPCTDFSVSGAQYWPAKDASGQTAESLSVADACHRLAVELSPDAWALENPVGRLWTLRPEWGKPWYFHPHNFAGYCEQPTTPESEWGIPEGLQSCRYTKKTGLVGRFNKPEFRDLPPVRYTSQGSWLQKLGGKSERTKELRSMTPPGFARAFYAANIR